MVRDSAYRDAAERIDKALRLGATKLDLSFMELTELPESLAQLVQLQSLSLVINRLTALPEWLGELTQLQSLRLSRNHLTTLPESIGQLTQLRSLNLSGNCLTALPKSIGQLTQLRSLDLSGNRLTALPESIGQLMQLQSLDLSDNHLAALPESIGRLARLNSLDLYSNQLTALPESVGQLTQLTSLDFRSNELATLPGSMGQLTQLTSFGCHSNQLTTLPESIGQLAQLSSLDLHSNQLTTLPESVGHLARLSSLDLHSNRLTTLPESIGQLAGLGRLSLGIRQGPDRGQNQVASLPASLVSLEHLRELHLYGNPLNPELAAAYRDGLDAVKTYLRELAKGMRKRFEAKLLILGDGNEGKTCVSRALRGLEFRPQVTTRGVDVEQWQFPHPDHPESKDAEITLNIWDFEGQEINHQTHQFFLTTNSLYLLVFKCRDQFLLDRAEYWLDTICARAPEAKVTIVITECENRTPYVPQDRLQAEYGDLLTGDRWLFPVGCADRSGVRELQSALKRWAADLNFMGRDWPESYARAESTIRERVTAETAQIDRGELHAVFADAGIDDTNSEDVASSMATLGVITQFPDCPDLRDFIVLQPQWLTKAISEIMEDRQLADDRGKISLQRMQAIWDAKGYGGLFATFHSCMKEFELCYDLDDYNRSCLVPLRFGYLKPDIPWSSGTNVRERRVNYRLSIRPPMGLMSRFIVKTHHMIVSTDRHPNGVYWHNGVFLRTGSGPLCSEALCEFEAAERTLSVTVRAAFPQNMIEQIHAYVKAVFSFFAGLQPARSYGCIRPAEEPNEEEQCLGMHSERRIYSAILKRRVLDCEHEFHDVDPRNLIWGLSSFGEYVVLPKDELRRELDKSPAWAEALSQGITRLLAWASQNSELLEQVRESQEALAPDMRQQMEQKLREYLGYISDILDDREFTSAPAIISINNADRSPWNPKTYFRKEHVLTPFCECEQNIHPCEDGCVAFSRDKEWWVKTAPWIARGTKVLSVGLQLALTGMPLVMVPSASEAIKNDVTFMNELAKHIELQAEAKDGGAEGLASRFGDDGLADMREADSDTRLMRAALSRFLEEVAPDSYRARQWGSLRRVRMRDNSHRWLCSACAERLRRRGN